ncbi:hypothetical protein QYF36_007699 [Acer negundo]|nr:hypothetical protein QYF36_007699 [Acer negundo]
MAATNKESGSSSSSSKNASLLLLQEPIKKSTTKSVGMGLVFLDFIDVEEDDVILAELLAILRACKLFGSRQELLHRPITVISDSKTAVNWVWGFISGNNRHD